MVCALRFVSSTTGEDTLAAANLRCLVSGSDKGTLSRKTGVPNVGSRYANGNASVKENFRRNGDQMTPICGISGRFIGYVFLIRPVRPGEQRAVPNSSGIGSHVVRFFNGWWSVVTI